MTKFINSVLGATHSARIFSLDPPLKEECSALSSLEFKKSAWKVASVVCLVLSGGTLFQLAILFYCLSKHFEELLASATYQSLDKSVEQIKRDMQVDLERGSELEIDGVIYRHDPSKQSSDDLVKEIIRQLLVVRKLDRYEMLLALKFAHQGTASLPLNYLKNHVRECTAVGRAYTRHVKIQTKGQDVFIRSIDKITLFEQDDQGHLKEDGYRKNITINSRLDFRSKQVQVIFLEEDEQIYQTVLEQAIQKRAFFQ